MIEFSDIDRCSLLSPQSEAILSMLDIVDFKTAFFYVITERSSGEEALSRQSSVCISGSAREELPTFPMKEEKRKEDRVL